MYLLRETLQSNPFTPQDIQITLLNEQQNSQWDNFVDDHPEGTFFHLSKWQSIFNYYFKLKTYYLMAWRNNVIIGILPLAHMKSVLFSNAFMSLPFCVYGGPLIKHSDALMALYSKACEIAQGEKAQYLEIRQANPLIHDGLGNDLYVHFEKKLFSDEESNMLSIPRKQRAMVRKATKHGLTYKIEEKLNNFYKNYSISLRNLGTPVLNKSYFEFLYYTFRDCTDILTVYKGNQPLSSVFSFYYKDRILPYYGGGGKQNRNLAFNDFMYWSLMNHAVQKKVNLFDFGRSRRNSGSYHFKRHWGFEAKLLPYRWILFTKNEKPNINPENPKYQWMIKCWQRLPLYVANIVGPLIARRLG